MKEVVSLKSFSLKPVSTIFGFDRGKPIDRYYIENFLRKIKNIYMAMSLKLGIIHTPDLGSNVTKSDVLDIKITKDCTIVGNLETGENIPFSALTVSS